MTSRNRPTRLVRPFAVLALWATLMMALVPAAGRLLLGLEHRTHGDLVAVELCTVDGRVIRLVDAALDPFRTPAPLQPARAHEDCGYCVLASTTTLVAPTTAILAPPSGDVAARVVITSATHPRHLCGLGSRGPPRVIA